ncbi:hypothetical protein BU23DRAFT_563203 [Bimuria novae-zelandiae CBS 107.79]|uniref:Uncharacterized protein n=1 Tax=Bimuria novae-zelandiae CBS 107.79 TaxID=1447943 RepID=A0A6A5VTA7_9PLEO|nr:hypothetical protein BU23DRAFT_563203 [Bimuria novae-zelandiae CBS 107.79]
MWFQQLQLVPSRTSLQGSVRPLSQDVDDDFKQQIVSTIWGKEAVGRISDETLGSFFRCYADQMLATTAGLPRRSPNAPTRSLQISTHEHLLRVLASLKHNHSIRRKDLKALIATEDLANHEMSPALDLAIKIMFMISCRSSVHAITTGHVFRPAWKDSESLSALIERVLPCHGIEPLERTEAIKAHKLRARYLKAYTRISVKWTDNLPDHLHLQVTEDWKTIQVFGQLGFLAAAIRALDGEDEDLCLEDSLSRYRT